MNFSAVRGYNAYSQFMVKVREAVKLQETESGQGIKKEKAGSDFNDSKSGVDIVDTVSISTVAHSRYKSSTIIAQRESPQATLKEWIKTSGGTADNTAALRVTGQTITELLATNGISLDEKETYSIDMDVWCAVSVTEKNAEKAKAIQHLLNTTPSGINWGFLLQKLPIGD